MTTNHTPTLDDHRATIRREGFDSNYGAHVEMCVRKHNALTARVAELEAALKLVAYGQKGISYAKAREQARAALAKGQA